MKNTNKIFISAGESSGDLLGANLARALLNGNGEATLQLTGMGGQRMRDAGVDIQFNSEKLAVVGVVEVITHLPSILSTWYMIKKYLVRTKPDLVILIDFPDTHFRIMKMAKKLGIPILYYVSPQIWAWRPHRIKQIKKYVDHMAVLFSFEEKIYQDVGVPVTFVGHPLSDLVKSSMSINAAYDYFKLNKDDPIIALFPGSRRSELKNHLSVMLNSVEKVRAKYSNAQCVLVLASHFDETIIRAQLPEQIKIVRDHLYDLLSITTVAIAVSGTVTLEIALKQVPHCIIYKLKPLSFWMVKKLIRIKNIGLCNIVAEKQIAREYIQDDAKSGRIADEIIKLLSDKTYHERLKKELAKIKNKISIAGHDSSEMVADIAMKLLASTR